MSDSKLSDSASEPLLGQTIGNYKVVRRIGQGAMGAVYEAAHPIIGRRVALKLLRKDACDNPELIERFFAEARVVNAIGNPHIVEVTDLGKTDSGTYYLAMELLAGESLRNRLHNVSQLPIDSAVHIGTQIATALAAAHASNIVHRDIKPDNVFLVLRESQVDFVKVLDFGVAKLIGREPEIGYQTRTGYALGTPYYMSPEQCVGAKDVDHRTDIYGLGVVLYEMITGRLPFLGKSFGELVVKHVKEAPVPPRALRPDIPAWLEATILRAMEKKPDHRFTRMEDFRVALATRTAPLSVVLPEQDIVFTAQGAPPSGTTPIAAQPTVAIDRATLDPDDKLAGTTLGHSASEISQVSRQISAHSLPLSSASTPARSQFRMIGGAVGLGALMAVVVATFLQPAQPLKVSPVPAVSRPLPAAPALLDESEESTLLAKMPVDPMPRSEAPAVKTTARMRIVTTPPGVEVWSEGERIGAGVTPLEVELPKGETDLVLRKSGFHPYAEHLLIEDDGVLDVALKRAVAKPTRTRPIRKSQRAPTPGAKPAAKSSPRLVTDL